MKEIQMVDLQSQYLKIKPAIDLGIQKVMLQTDFIRGKLVGEFEENLAKHLQVKHVISCGNGTDALQIALMSLDLNPGDEVITTNFTFAATVEVIILLGLTPVLVDVDLKDFNINTQQLKSKITDKTKAIIPVHLFGFCANMHEILTIGKEFQLQVIEDTAQALGANYKLGEQFQKAGTLGDIGTTSFFPSKNLGCYGDGGAIFTNNDMLATKIRSIANHGMSQKYQYDRIGVNSRLDTLQACILNIKLPFLEKYNQARIKAANFYNQAFINHPAMVIPTINPIENKNHHLHVFHQYTLKITNGQRDELHQYLKEHHIPSAIYYPIPLHQQKAYQKYTKGQTGFENTEILTKQVLSLPMHTELDDIQLEYITQTILNFFK